jgi:ATP-dependent Clp endopeptidase proteolytic subunit ClpP
VSDQELLEVYIYPEGTPLEEMDLTTLSRLHKVQEIRETTAKAAIAEQSFQVGKLNWEEYQAKSHRHHIYEFDGVVDGRSVGHCIEVLGSWSRQHPGCPMTVYFNSGGGSVIHGLALYDYIQELKARGHHITTVGLGMAASMGGILLQAGNVRVMTSNSWLLIHEVSSGTVGKFSEIEDEVAFLKRLQRQLVAILASRSTLTQRQIMNRWTRKDWWLDAQEALVLGFIDEVR